MSSTTNTDQTDSVPSILNNSTLNHINSRSELKDAIWNQNTELFDTVKGSTISTLAKELSWDSFEFEKANEQQRHPVATPLEALNSRTLSVLAPDGTVYQLGDKIRFETTKSCSRWTLSSSNETITVENYIDYLGSRTASLSKHPTYSNAPRDSPTAHFGRDEITHISGSDLNDYRTRLTEGTNIPIPETVNGWQLTEVEETTHDTDLVPTDLITKMQWSNREQTHITAQWRGAYNVWYLSTPCESVLTDENEDEYLYEVDVPQQIVTTEEILLLAKEAMNTLDPNGFQAPYDLRNPDDIDDDSELRAGPAPVPIPEQLGDWQRVEHDKYSMKWENTNAQSPWENYTVKIDSNGGVRIRNENVDEIHDTRYIKKHAPNGEPYPGNIEENYEWRRRDMYEENWHYGIAFMIQTSYEPMPEHVVTELSNKSNSGTNLNNFDHTLSTDPHETTNRDNGNILAYQ